MIYGMHLSEVACVYGGECDCYCGPSNWHPHGWRVGFVPSPADCMFSCNQADAAGAAKYTCYPCTRAELLANFIKRVVVGNGISDSAVVAAQKKLN